jgi:hypothetical protein
MYLPGDHGIHDAGFCIVDDSPPDAAGAGQNRANPLT